VIYTLSFTITFPSSQTISHKAILFTALFQSFATFCSTILRGVSKNQYLSTFAYEAKCNTNQIFGPSGVAIGHILQY
jgi:hypothetical protein